MKSRFPLVFLWVLFCLASFAVIDCSKNEEKNLASGYTEENNAWNGLDSTLAKLLETWDSEVASDSVERRGTGEAVINPAKLSPEEFRKYIEERRNA